MRKWVATLVIIIAAVIGLIFWDANRPASAPADTYQPLTNLNNTQPIPSPDFPLAEVKDNGQVVNEPPPADEPNNIVEHAIKVLAVPFTPQAPFANWDMPYQEACEEASIIMLVDFVLGRKDLQLPAAEADERIVELVNWETENNYSIDITAAEVARVLRERFNIKAMAVPYSAKAIKEQINLGHPVIIPAAGRLLGNPYFNQPGPLYHMLVVKGYEGDEFITNDPGTRRGESYRYQALVLDRAVHDWNGGDVENGSQVMVVLE